MQGPYYSNGMAAGGMADETGNISRTTQLDFIAVGVHKFINSASILGFPLTF
jgi:hypothetical protein